MTEPRLLFLDEPASGLDLPAREALIGALSDLSLSNPELATVVISHHLEELAPTTSHAMLMRAGAIVAAGSVDTVLTDKLVSDTFAIPVMINRTDGRWTARGVGSWHGR
jgi:iron complex transport system ATP-binding protein